MAYTIRLLGLSGPPMPLSQIRDVVPTYTDGAWVQSFDAERGVRSLVCTMDRPAAIEFETQREAIEFYQSIGSPPVRPDGLPNRPLTAFHVEVSRND